MSSTSQTTHLQIRFANKFLKTLKKLKKSQSSKNMYRRSREIKTASYSSMALSVGTNRAWARALLSKIRRRRRFRHLSWVRKRCSRKKRPVRERELSQLGKLRELVPGGEMMDLCKLLEETAHYIKCLDTQVKVMKNISDALSASS